MILSRPKRINNNKKLERSSNTLLLHLITQSTVSCPSTTKCKFFFLNNKLFFLQKSNRLSTKQDHRLSQKSLILKNGKKQKHSKKSTKNPTNVPLSLLIPRLELQDQSVLECDGTLHRAEKKPCGLSRLWRCCGSRED